MNKGLISGAAHGLLCLIVVIPEPRRGILASFVYVSELSVRLFWLATAYSFKAVSTLLPLRLCCIGINNTTLTAHIILKALVQWDVWYETLDHSFYICDPCPSPGKLENREERE